MYEKISVKTVDELIKRLTEFEEKTIEIPPFTLPHWPGDINVSFKIDSKNAYKLIITGAQNTLLEYRQIKCEKINFMIIAKGQMRITVWEKDYSHGVNYDSNSTNRFNRLCFVFLFEQFQEKICSTIIAELCAKLGMHNEIVEKMQKLFEPFMPYVAAEELLKGV